jgi:hypothetical protein
MLGQWFAHVVGLGHVLPEDHVRTTMRSIMKHNFRTDLAAHHSCQRTYALNHEGGLLICSWPNGGRPRYPFPYADEVWTGIEYQVAAHLIYEGMIEEALAIVETLRARHDGIARNPWDEFECGHHYARAMSSWSLLLALSGYHYSAPAGRLSFAPSLSPNNFRCFFSTGSGWGSFSQRLSRASRMAYDVEARYGSLSLRTLHLAVPDGVALSDVVVSGPSGKLAAKVAITQKTLAVELDKAIVLHAGERLRVTGK